MLALWDHLRIAHGQVVKRSEVKTLAGIYNPEEDKTEIREGERVFPVQEKFSKHHYARFADPARETDSDSSSGQK